MTCHYCDLNCTQIDESSNKSHLVAPTNSASPNSNSSRSSASSGSHAVNGVKAQQNSAADSSSSTPRSAKPPNCIQVIVVNISFQSRAVKWI